jgi:hypothetical protein
MITLLRFVVVCSLVVVSAMVLAAIAHPRQPSAVEAFGLSRMPTPADLPPQHPQGPTVQDNWEQHALTTVASNWEQRGALTKRAADLDVFPPGFGEPGGSFVGKQGKKQVAKQSMSSFHASRINSQRQQLSKVSGNEIIGDPARVDQPGRGELIFSSDGTPVQPTPWDLQWNGGTPGWAKKGGKDVYFGEGLRKAAKPLSPARKQAALLESEADKFEPRSTALLWARAKMEASEGANAIIKEGTERLGATIDKQKSVKSGGSKRLKKELRDLTEYVLAARKSRE